MIEIGIKTSMSIQSAVFMYLSGVRAGVRALYQKVAEVNKRTRVKVQVFA